MNSVPFKHREAPSGTLVKRGSDAALCRQTQVDLSAMLDGELDPATVRRVLRHVDGCSGCHNFLAGIRAQLHAHRDLAAAGLGDADDAGARLGGGNSELAEQLMQNRHQLARILYELGRGYVLMGISPQFSREVAQEPVPVPDMQVRGRHLVDEVERMIGGSGSSDGAGSEWARAKELFGPDGLASPPENMSKGKRLLSEALMLRADYHSARIYLGHAYHVCGQRELARREFQHVIDHSDDPTTRAFALENLGTVFLEEGDAQRSIECFSRLIESGVMARESRFFTSYFNLALAYGLLGDFDSCGEWFRRLYQQFPHKRRLVANELRSRGRLVELLREHPEIEARFAQELPSWFPVGEQG